MIKKVVAKSNMSKKVKSNLKLGDNGYEAQFVGIVTEAIMDVVDRKMDDINRGLHVVLEKNMDDFRVYGDAISGIHNQLDRMNARLDGIDGRLDGIDGRLDNLEGDVGQIKEYIFKNVEPRMHVLEIRDKEMA